MGVVQADGLDPHRFQLPAETVPKTSPTKAQRRVMRRAKQGRFVKGPIPLDWLTTAAHLPGRALLLGLLIWYRAGLEGASTMRVPAGVLRAFGLDRDAKARALHALEAAGLVTVRRQRGCAADITLLTSASEDAT